MEYFAGSVITLLTVFAIYLFFKRENLKVEMPVLVTQSKLYESSFIAYARIPEKKITQASKFKDKNRSVVAFYEGMAYWIEGTTLYSAIEYDGVIQSETKKAVDVISADDVQLEAISFIVEKLTEGNKDDSFNSGDKDLF